MVAAGGSVVTRAILSLDVGQAQDYCALGAGFRIPRATGKQRRTWNGSAVEVEELRTDDVHVRLAKRFELHTPYPEVVRELVRVTNSKGIKGNYDLVVDYTGVGRPIVDMCREAGLSVIPVTITGGTEERYDPTDGAWRVPKRILVSIAQMFLQQERVQIAQELALADTIVKELLAFRVKINANAHASFEAWREGAHDDLVLMLALMLWWAAKAPSGARMLDKPADVMSAEYEQWSEEQLDARLKAEQEERERWGLT